jgi:hypothetical protein
MMLGPQGGIDLLGDGCKENYAMTGIPRGGRFEEETWACYEASREVPLGRRLVASP